MSGRKITKFQIKVSRSNKTGSKFSDEEQVRVRSQARQNEKRGERRKSTLNEEESLAVALSALLASILSQKGYFGDASTCKHVCGWLDRDAVNTRPAFEKLPDTSCPAFLP